MSSPKVIFGFHAVGVRIKTAPASVIEVLFDPTRRDARMKQFLSRAQEAGVRLIEADGVRLAKLAGSHGHQGVAARVNPVEQVRSLDELLESLEAAGTAPLVAFHADFDRALIERATSAALGVRPVNAWLDLALIAPAVLRSQPRPLDAWLERFGIENHDRHDAVADAFATAKLLLVVLARARAQGIDTWAGLAAAQRDQRWLERAGNPV